MELAYRSDVKKNEISQKVECFFKVVSPMPESVGFSTYFYESSLTCVTYFLWRMNARRTRFTKEAVLGQILSCVTD